MTGSEQDTNEALDLIASSEQPDLHSELGLKTALKKISNNAAPFALSRIANVGGSYFIASFVARLGRDALAATGLIFPVAILITTTTGVALFSVGSEIGGSVSQGPEHTDKYFKNGLILSVLLGSTFGTVNYLAMPSILRACNQPDAAVDIFSEFNGWYSLSLIPTLLFDIEQQFALGAKRPWLVLTISVINISLNVLLAYMLVLGKFGVKSLGVAGIGLAACIVNSLTFCLFGVYLAKTSHQHRLFRGIVSSVDKKLILKTFLLGIPYAFGATIELLANEILNIYGGQYGSDALGGIAIANNSISFVKIPLFTIATSLMYVSKNVMGSLNNGSVNKNLRTLMMGGLLMALMYACLGYVVLILGAIIGFLINPFLSEETQNNHLILTIAKNLLLVFGATQIFNALRFTLNNALYVYDKTLFIMLNSAVFFAVLGLPLAYLFGFHLGFSVVDAITAIYLTRTVMSCAAVVPLCWKWKKENTVTSLRNTSLYRVFSSERSDEFSSIDSLADNSDLASDVELSDHSQTLMD